MIIDRSKHDHGAHDAVARAMEGHAKGLSENTPHAVSDIAMVHAAELNPHITDGSLRGSVQAWLENGNDYRREGHSAHGGNNYEWDGEELRRRFSKP